MTRAERRARAAKHIAKQAALYASTGRSVATPHKYHKKSALGCSSPRCNLCMNPRKMYGNSANALTPAELSARQLFNPFFNEEAA